MDRQDWQGKCLDKDIRISGNKLYSPNGCAFITQELNKLLLSSATIRGSLPIGVSYDKARDKYLAKCNVKGKGKFLGRFTSVEMASDAYCKFKAKIIREAALANGSLCSEIMQYASILESKHLMEVA